MISAELSRRIAKARQSEVFLRDLAFDDYLIIIDTLATSDAQSFDDLPNDIQELVKRAESATLTASGDAFHLLGKHNQDSHGRDKPDRVKSSGETTPGKKLKITHGLIHSKHEPGKIIAVNGSGKKRVVWDGSKYLLQEKDADGGWPTKDTAIKSKAYARVNEFDSEWHEPASDGDGNTKIDVADAPKPKKTAGTGKKKSSGNPGDPLKITHGLVHQKHEPGTVIAESADGSTRVKWNGKEYELQVKDESGSSGKWETADTFIKSKAYEAINAFGSNWVVPKNDSGSGTSDSKQANEDPASFFDDPAQVDNALNALNPTEPESNGSSSPTTASSKYPLMDPTLIKLSTLKKGGVFKDKYGDLFNIQPAQSEKHARNELLASKLYAYAAVGVQHVHLVQTDPDKLKSPSGVGVKTDYKPGEVGLINAMKTMPHTKKMVNENFAFDAWLGNWDVVGMGYDNIAVAKNGVARRTNLGGSLLYRANGQPKGDAFGDTVTEIDSLRNPYVNPSAAKVFADVTDEDIRKGVAKIEAITDDDIEYLVSQSGFTGDEAAQISSKLMARRDNLVSKYGSNTSTSTTPANAPASSTQPTATNALGGTKAYTASQKAKVYTVFNKHNLKWFNKSDAIYDAALEVSKTHSDLTMGDALDIMDQSLKKKTGNPFRTKVEKFLKTKAGKTHALTVGGSSSLGGTSSTVPAGSAPSTSNLGTTVPEYGQYKKMNRAAASIMQKKMDELVPPPWTTEQRDALRTYTGSSYTTINKCARGVTPCAPQTLEQIKQIKAGMKPSTEDIMIFRKTNPKAFGLENASDMQTLVGKVISDDGVISTSIRNNMWDGLLHLEIEAPKGSMLAWVQPISLHPGEDEIVVSPGTHYEVISVTPYSYGNVTSSAKYVVRLRIIPGSDAHSKDLAAKKAQEEKEKAEKEQAKKVSKQGIDALLAAYNDGYVVEKEFTAGNSSSKTELLRLANGTRVVRKSGGVQLLSKKPDTRFEYLSGRVWNALGGTDVHTAQVNDDTVITTFVEGEMGGKLLTNTYKSGNTNQENKKAYKEETLRQVQLPGGKEIGLLDYLIANQDRHSLNWIVGPNNDKVRPIDQGGAVFVPDQLPDDKDKSVMRSMYLGSDFTDYWLGIRASWYVKSMKPKFTKAELAQYRTRLESIKDEFAEGEETEWYNSMMSRLAQVESKVKA